MSRRYFCFIISLVFSVSFSAYGQLCPPEGCGTGWVGSIRSSAEGTSIDNEINSSEGQMFMYNVRDFIATSPQLGHIAVDIYQY